MADILVNSRHKYNIGGLPSDIKFGAIGPDRMGSITMRCVTKPFEIKDDTTGNVFDIEVPVDIECYVRDNKAVGKRREPPQVIQIEKYLIDFIALNKFSLQNEGISHIIITGTQTRPVDKEEYDLANWYKLTINVLLVYRLRYEVVTQV